MRDCWVLVAMEGDAGKAECGAILTRCSLKHFCIANLPETECAKHGVKTMPLSGAGKHSRFTQLFEIVALDVILASRSLKDAGKLLRLSWDPLRSIMKRAVERGLERRGLVQLHFADKRSRRGSRA